MRRTKPSTAKIVALVALAVCLLAAHALPAGAAEAKGVLTGSYNSLRDGWDPGEPSLSPATVQSPGFGELFTTKLAGQIYAQPLVVGNTVVVTTEKANAYGVNATTGAVIWKRAFGTPFKASTIGCSDLKPDIGSTATPVIDPATETVYLTTRLQEGKGIAGSHWYLQALSASTGQEKAGFPIEIKGTPYNTPGIPFNEGHEFARPALLLLGGVVYVAFASNCDINPYRGIVVGVNASSGAISTMWSDEAGAGAGASSQSGIWQSGSGLVSDIPGRIIVTTGNGVSPQPAPSNKPPETESESVVGLSVGAGGKITASQFFAPSNAPALDQADEDFGSGGPIALPTEYFGTKAHPHLLVQVGKDGRIFLLDADNMGGYKQGKGGADEVLQTLGPFHGVWGRPAAYGGQGGWVYELESSGGGQLRALRYGTSSGGVPQLSSAATSSETFGYSSGSPIVTSNGTAAGSAVVWVIYTSSPKGTGGQLRAYNATASGGTLPLLWSGSIGKAIKFSVPTAYQGRVYVGTLNGRLYAFGPSGKAAVQAAPVEAGSVAVGQSTTVTLPALVTRALTLTAPVSASGVEAAPNPLGPLIEGAGGAKTAGPSSPPWSGTAPLSRGVLRIVQPRVGTAVLAGATLPLRVRFTPKRPGPVVATVEIHTSAGVESVSVTGYGTAPGV
ncbi:MAG TPA: PQQ-binding-like beta-propeller repeat protein, partial [Solirubrobacteraceae bacterium]|nr:PQQ-binding-like beta-propeller repeat protein [Solirubrobacteraceae bacterium]